DPHAASAELALDRIAAGEQLLEGQEFGAERRGHVSRVLRAERRRVSRRVAEADNRLPVPPVAPNTSSFIGESTPSQPLTDRAQVVRELSGNRACRARWHHLVRH